MSDNGQDLESIKKALVELNNLPTPTMDQIQQVRKAIDSDPHYAYLIGRIQSLERLLILVAQKIGIKFTSQEKIIKPSMNVKFNRDRRN